MSIDAYVPPSAPPVAAVRTWTWVDELGAVIGTYSAPDDVHLENSRPVGGVTCVEGRYAAYSHSFDAITGRMEEHSAAEIERALQRPGDGWRWDGLQRVWIDGRSPAALAAARRVATLASIERIEAKQPRALREVALGMPGAQTRLQALDDQIAQLRAQIS